MKRMTQAVKYGAIALATALPAAAMAADIDAEALTSGISSASSIIIAVGTAIFGLVGLLVALNYSKRAAK